MAIILLCTALIGLIMGSFFNVIIYRLPIMLERGWQKDCENFLGLTPTVEKTQFNLCLPASHCPKCQHKLAIIDNIPLLSFIFLRGKCRYCQAKISYQYLIVELLSALAAVIAIAYFGLTWKGLLVVVFSWFLICLSGIDWRKQILPDVINYCFLWLGLIVNLFNIFTTTKSAVIGAVVGYISLWLINSVYRLLTKKDGIGQGDFKLLASLGAWLGWQQIPFIILISALIGSLVGILLILSRKHEWQRPIPYGPYLALAGWLALLFGTYFLNWYWSVVL